VNGDVWAGYYRSTDGGSTWQDSLVPGYPADTSPAGLASPVHGSCSAAGDPTQSFDSAGRAFYGFICFNRVKPINGSIYVSAYGSDGASYQRTVLVARGTPSGLFGAGLFQDKVNLAVDQTSGLHAGNVYVAWAQFNGFAPNNVILFSRSTDHGMTFSAPIRIAPVNVGGAEFADLAVGPDGNVYLTFRTFPSPSSPVNVIWLAGQVHRRRRLLRRTCQGGHVHPVRLEPVQRQREPGLRGRTLHLPLRVHLRAVRKPVSRGGRRDRGARGVERGAPGRPGQDLRPQFP